jgi:hypothetical protein
MTGYNDAINYDATINYNGSTLPPPANSLSFGGPSKKRLKEQESLSEAQMLAEIEMAQERRRREDDEDAFIILM